MRATQLKQLLCLAVLLTSCWVTPASAWLQIVENYVDTNGHGSALAVRGYHVFLADGPRGLKIFNLSYPRAASLTGRVSVPGGIMEDVAVDGDMVVLTDATNKRVHFVDVWNLMRPRVAATVAAGGDVPRRIH